MGGNAEIEGGDGPIAAALHQWHWMARRYCDGRMSTAANSFNDTVRRLRAMGMEFRAPLFARDGMGRAYDGLTNAEAQEAEDDAPRGFAAIDVERAARLAAVIAEAEMRGSNQAAAWHDRQADFAGRVADIDAADGDRAAAYEGQQRVAWHRAAAAAIRAGVHG